MEMILVNQNKRSQFQGGNTSENIEIDEVTK